MKKHVVAPKMVMSLLKINPFCKCFLQKRPEHFGTLQIVADLYYRAAKTLVSQVSAHWLQSSFAERDLQ